VPLNTFANRTSSLPLSELDANFTFVSDSTNLSFLQSGTGAVSRTVQAKERDIVSVKDFGAVGDGTTDDTAAIQAAITANYNKCIYFPAGTYKVTSSLTVTGAIFFRGDGRDQSIISWTSTTLDVISVASATAVHFQGLQFSGPASATAGAIITLAHSSSGVNYFSSFQDCTFSRGYDQIKTVSAAAWTIRNCYFSAWVRRAITVNSANTPDAGDSAVYGNWFANGIAGSVAIYQVSSGGLKVTGNKFNGLGNYAYQMQLASAAVTSILIFTGNSIENHTTAAMKFDTDGGGASFTQVVITGNQFALSPYFIDMSTASAFLTKVVITGNSFALNASGTYAINMGAVTQYEIAGNTIAGGGGTPTGILLGASCTGGQLGLNNYISLAAPVNDSAASKATNYASATTVGTNGVQFPATQVASSDVNMLDDYEEGTWTPALTFATPGDLSVAYTTQLGFYTKVGNVVNLWWNIVTSTFAHTPASGAVQITGAPFTSNSTSGSLNYGSLSYQGINKASFNQIVPRLANNGTTLEVIGSGNSQAATSVNAADMTTGSTVILRGHLAYRT